MIYLDEAAEQLRKARADNEARAGLVTTWLSKDAAPVITEVNQRRMEIADGFIRLAAIERAIPPDPQILPHELDMRIGAALKYAENGIYDGEHHKAWTLDQMVRALTGCPMVTKTGTDHRGVEYDYRAQGESEEYREWVSGVGGWDEGTAP